MKSSDIPFNMEIEIQEDLREAPISYDEMKKGIAFLKDKVVTLEDDLEKAMYYSMIGSYSRVVLELNEAELFLKKALEIYEEHKKKVQAFAVKIRLAITYQWQENFTAADSFFYKAQKICEKSKNEKIKDYLDFVLQHYGKSKFEQRQYKAANKLFVKALELRVAKGQHDLIESSQQAITICNKFLN